MDVNVKVDVPGLEPIAKATSAVVDRSTEGVGKVLGAICLPSAQELGLLFQDRIAGWRKINALKFEQKLASTMGDRIEAGEQAHPRLATFAFMQASLTDDDELHSKWANLLAASCRADRPTEANMPFMDMLSRLSPDQARMLDYIASISQPVRLPRGVILSGMKQPLADVAAELKLPAGDVDLLKDHLVSCGLVRVVDADDGMVPEWVMTDLGAGFYLRCLGFVGTLEDYFDPVPTLEELRAQGRTVILPFHEIVSRLRP